MSMSSRSRLRTVLLVDAVTCTAMGALLALAARPLGDLMQLPVGLLLYAGLALFPIAAFMAAVACVTPASRIGALLVVVGNVGWVLASLALLVTGGIAPNALGLAFIVGQALVVAVLAKLEYDAMGAAALPADGVA